MATLHAKRANSKRLQQTLVEVLVPTTPVTRLGVGNRPVVRFEKMFPGYVYVHMHMDKDTWYIIKNSNHVQNFVGHDNARRNAGGGIQAGRGHVVPTPLTRAEERRIFDRIAKEGAINSGSEVDQSMLRFKVGSIVQVISGHLAGNQGKVIEFDHDRNRYKVRLDIFKSELPSELSPEELVEVTEEGPVELGAEGAAFEADALERLSAAMDDRTEANPWKRDDEF